MLNGWYAMAPVVHFKDGMSCYGGFCSVPIDDANFFSCLCGEKLRVEEALIPLNGAQNPNAQVYLKEAK